MAKQKRAESSRSPQVSAKPSETPQPAASGTGPTEGEIAVVLTDQEAALIEKLTGKAPDDLPSELVERFAKAVRRHEKCQANVNEAEARVAKAFRGVLNVVRNISEGRREPPKKADARFSYWEVRGVLHAQAIAVHTVVYIEAERAKRELESVGSELVERQA